MGRKNADAKEGQTRCQDIHDATLLFVGGTIGAAWFPEFFVSPEKLFLRNPLGGRGPAWRLARRAAFSRNCQNVNQLISVERNFRDSGDDPLTRGGRRLNRALWTLACQCWRGIETLNATYP